MDTILEALSDKASAKATKMEKLRLDRARANRRSAMQAARGLKRPEHRDVFITKARTFSSEYRKRARELNKKYGT
jgi:hypothetical protein